MIFFVTFCFSAIIAMYILFLYTERCLNAMKQQKQGQIYIYYLLLGAFLVRCLFAFFYKGFLSDIACFSYWSNRVFTGGFADFYSPDVFTDYPPGYMYVLYVVGAVMSALKTEYLSGLSLLLLKLPAILCDMASGYIIHRVASKKFTRNTSLILSAVYLFNPAVFVNSSMWGQVDAVFTLALLLLCLLLTEGKTIPAYFVFAIGVLMKPQMLIFTPLVLFGIYEYVFAKGFERKNFLRNLFGGLGAIVCMLLAAIPYGLDTVLKQYGSTLGSYPYISVNAYNFWSFWGLNWSSQDKKFLFLTYGQFGTVVIVLLTLISAYIFIRKIHSAERYFASGAFIIITMFLFSVRMHERYLFPAMMLLLFTFLSSNKKPYFNAYIAISVAHFLNVWHVLFYYDPHNYDAKAASIILISLLSILGGANFYITLCKDIKGKVSSTMLPFSAQKSSGNTSLLDKICSPKAPEPSRKSMAFTRVDWILMLSVTLFYACFAFHDLGITETPKTEYPVPYYTYLEISSDNGEPIATLNWYLLNEQDIDFTLETKSDTDDTWTYIQDFTMKSVFSWGTLTLPEPADNIRITNMKEDAVIGEIVIQNSEGNVLPVKNSHYYPQLYDEASVFPETINHLSGCYFDEIYYTRTAYEFMNGLRTYENTHPPFGKVLITLGAMLFGTTPFGFRFMGTLFGVLMLPFMYLLGRNISRNRFVGAFTAFLFAFDFMHFAQTRLTTIDVYITFFVIVMYYFMERYINTSFYDTPLKKTWIPLGACGIAFGFGIASKWTGAYAGAGLAIIFFASLVNRYREYRYALAKPKGATNNIRHNHIIKVFKENILRTIGFCMIFFVVIPFVIYLLSYLPFVDSENRGLFARMLHNQESMFNYHSTLDATHPYSSTWIQWPIMTRPMFYYSNVLEGTMRQGISSFGNPLVWWVGIPAFIYMLYLAVTKKKKTASFLCVGYLAQFLPWVLVTRCTFIYHYFPSVPFLVLMIAYAFNQLKRKVKPMTFIGLLTGYAVAAFLLFLLFYPILSGQPIDKDFVVSFLRWGDGWVFVI